MTMPAGMPRSCMVPSDESPGVRMVTLIGSTRTWFAASPRSHANCRPASAPSRTDCWSVAMPSLPAARHRTTMSPSARL